MRSQLRNFSLRIAAGGGAALIQSMILWLADATGFIHHLNISLSYHWTSHWFCSQFAVGALWGLTFLLPFLSRFYFLRGILLSFIPSFIQLFVLFPFFDDAGFLGNKLGSFVPLFVVASNLIWGMLAGIWLGLIE